MDVLISPTCHSTVSHCHFGIPYVYSARRVYKKRKDGMFVIIQRAKPITGINLFSFWHDVVYWSDKSQKIMPSHELQFY